MDLKTIAERLKYIRSLTGLNRTELSNNHTFPEITLRMWENNHKPLTDKGIRRCIELYHLEGIFVTEEWLKHGTGQPPIRYTSLTSFKANDEENLIKEQKYLKDLYPGITTYTIYNNDMTPFFNIGDLVGGIFQESNFEGFHNKDCITKLSSGKIVFRRFMIAKNNSFNLIALNPQNDSDEPIIYNAHVKELAPLLFHRVKL
ncbi:hypothetical protein EF513_06055 [Rickettsiales endosymbiont of Stachyamoeba lipophora]|nr:hypothetical protein EF513_06055 [Rickettsiales endosymbiont of Stachyamoeba lipophora]